MKRDCILNEEPSKLKGTCLMSMKTSVPPADPSISSLDSGRSSLTPPVTQAPQVTNGTQCYPYPGLSSAENTKTSSQKKSPSQPHLEKQNCRASNEGNEHPYLPPGAQEDCCVQCTLALLFCQFLSLCNLLLDILTCGSCSADSAGFCCSCCSAGGCPDCADSCSTDCGIVDACCESADCLEICMECCGLCFSS
ncbi:myoD family inhibitor-like [Pseudophryne corroboree]|uniref:myoD family inhibitor-like n=1 Tax=Pseudophryne corroboree TaxID=495146 RepID=UPI003082039F